MFVGVAIAEMLKVTGQEGFRFALKEQPLSLQAFCPEAPVYRSESREGGNDPKTNAFEYVQTLLSIKDRDRAYRWWRFQRRTKYTR
jgi:hypothetical protein